ncbi:clusterin-like protein 1 isoform X2 [Corythoichthys intestinalis]|nr:clusterin-like protein 1 isoform X2 [Corythoichthys intestinalis]XP_057713206.1 clusterin-like protein 1 isoform X2 [Corythoichthys intestinalis]XP_061794811.1 clusterin-like protein 1 [Nerophis lumbriciformis]
MKVVLTLLFLTSLVTIISGASDNTNPSEDALKELSEAGEKAVGEEVKRALYGVGQMKDVLWKNQRKHEHLIKSLLHSGEKKKGAAQLTQDVTEKLQEAEAQCRVSLQSEWDECRPCLEDACKTFFTNTCRRGFATFQTKVENFFRRVSRRLSFSEPIAEMDDGQLNQNPDDSDSEVVRIQDAFTRLSRKVETLVNSSAALASRMSDGLDQAVRRALLSGPPMASATQDPDDPARDSGFLQGVGLEEVLESFFDFGRSVVEEFGAVVTQAFDGLQGPQPDDRKREKLFPRLLRNRLLCRELRKQSSECWQLQSQCEACQGSLLTECPSVRELHVELEQASQLLGISQEQYDEVLSIVRRHTDETLGWLGNMAAEFGWVARADTRNLFRLTRVAPKSQDQNMSARETQVEVNILDSPPFIFSVPGELQLQDPAFIQFVAQEALDKYKGMVRYEEDE